MYGSSLRLNEMNGSVLHDADETGDHFISEVRLDLEERYGLKAPEPDTVRAILFAATKRKFHPVRAFLEERRWDGTPRIARVAAEILRAQSADPDECELHSLLLARWFIGLVRRPLEAGVKFDTTLIIQGAQGTGKSTFFRIIAEPWFSDILREWRDQLLAEAVHRFRQGEPHWLTEAEEARRAQLAAAFGDADPWEESVLQHVRSLPEVRLAELLASPIGIPRDKQGQRELRRLADILRRAGFEPVQRRIGGEQARVWISPGKAGQVVRTS